MKKLGVSLETFDILTCAVEPASPNSALDELFGPPDPAGLDVLLALKRFRDWEETVNEFEADPCFKNSFPYLQKHPIFWYFHEQGVEPTERNLVTDRGLGERAISLELFLNKSKETRFWVEAGPQVWCFKDGLVLSQGTHDINLDTSANTYEKAITRLARRVHKYYGNDRRKISKF